MKTPLVIIVSSILVGCTAVPVSQKFPEAPEVLMEKCGPLKTIDKSEVLLSEFTATVVENYSKYHMCSAVVEAWQEWYKEQEKLHK